MSNTMIQSSPKKAKNDLSDLLITKKKRNLHETNNDII